MVSIIDKNDNLVGKFDNQYKTRGALNKMDVSISVSSIRQALKRKTHKSRQYYIYYENEL